MKVPLTRSEQLFWIFISSGVFNLKLIGLVPFTVQIGTLAETYPDNYHSRAFLVSKTGLAYNISLSILVPVMAAFTIPRMFTMRYNYKSSLTQPTDLCMGIFCVSTAWFVIIYWTLKRRTAGCIMNKLLKVYIRLSGFRNPPTTKKMFKLFIIHAIINVYLWITVWTTDIIDPVMSDVYVLWFIFNIPSYVIYWFVLEYFVIVGFVARGLEALNKNLFECQEFNNYLQSLNGFNGYSSVWNSTTYNQLAFLDLLHNIRTTLYELSREISDFFSLPMLLCVAYSFLALISNVYYMVTLAVVKNDGLTLTSASSCVALILTSIYPLALLFFNVTEAVAEAKQTGRIVSKLLVSPIKQEMKRKLNQFSLQLLHEDISFTAYGFFKLDFTLLHSMLGATATYLVILIQFQ